ncbi:hypothetical protein OG21DRAFT_1500722 [Imleria badia]|nr:hypothetical protein OG21DRAFT_1500722 [Imleria badia]
MTTPSTMMEHSFPIEIDTGGCTMAVTFTTNGEYLVVSNYTDGAQVWRVKDAKQIATIKLPEILALALSKDDRWIAAVTDHELFLLDAKTHEKVFMHEERAWFNAVDFSPDSTRLLTGLSNHTAIIWDIATHKQVRTLHHDDSVIAAKFSPQGDRIATGTWNSVRVWDSNDGRLLMDIPVKVTPGDNKGLLWFDDLFVLSDSTIREFHASTGSPVSEWPVPKGNWNSCIALPQHGEFIAYSTNDTVTFLDTSTHTQLGLINHTKYISSIAFSPDDEFLAIGGVEGKITIKKLKDVLLLSSFTLPFIDITIPALKSWKRDQLADCEISLTETITNHPHKKHFALANRTLVRSHLQHWNLAIDDAENSIKICPSAIGYIARSVALIGGGKKAEGCRLFDLAFRHCDPIDVDLLLLIKAVVLFMAGEYVDAVSRVGDLIPTTKSGSLCYLVQAYMYLLLGNSCMENGDYKAAIDLFERPRAQMRYYSEPGLFTISLISHWRFDDLGITIRRRLCEALYAAGRTKDAAESLLNLVNPLDEDVSLSRPITTEWVSDFTHRCLSASESDAVQHTNPPTLQATLNTSTSALLLKAWAKATMANRSWKDGLASAVCFMTPRSTTYQVVCEHLEAIDRITDAAECFRQMDSELGQHTDSEREKWRMDFQSRCGRKLEDLGDLAMGARRHEEAISKYSAALSLDPINPQVLFVKRSKARANLGFWKDALNDANEVIMANPSSPLGYERKHAALGGAGYYADAIHAFETMLSKILESSDPEIRELSRHYVNPAQTEATIRGAIENVIRESPLVLINTNSGRLLDKSGQSSSFETQPIFLELVSSMTTDIDHVRIEHEVAQYYRYATFSHKWKDNEPLFEKVIHICVHDLEESLTHDKLKMFCKIVRDAGLHWAWSDTCCINKADPSVLQEGLVSMFQWYQTSTMTVVLLCDVCSPSRLGDLVRSIWNTRAWTFQEYHASKVVRFYNRDWTLYRNLDIPNHKESPEIISEMEEATGVSAQALMALRPGLEDIREKLRLASTRQTTRIEDAAYSLLGIFSLSSPVVYGEGDKALGRLLAQLLMSSGDTSILAWTGRSGCFNSCLPVKIAVFSQLPTSHIPLAITTAEMEKIAAGYRTSSVDLISVTKLYERLNDLPVPVFVGKRMKLPCLVFKLGPLSVSRSTLERVFRAQTAALGIVEIKTEEDLSRLNSLYLVHPWIDFLLDRQPIGSAIETIPEDADNQSPLIGELPSFSRASGITSAAPQTRTGRLASRFGFSFGQRTATVRPGDVASLRPPSTVAESEKQLRALLAIVRLRQPFGALLLTPNPGNVAAYRRVASESLITVQVEEITPTILNKLVDSVRVLDVL